MHPSGYDVVSEAAANAAIGAARERLGIECHDPVPLPGVANRVYWLRPHPVVAKVGTRRDDLVREYHVVSALRELDAPVAEPIGTPVVRPEISAVVTLWVRLDTLEDDPPDAELGDSLRVVHDALAKLDMDLPPLRNHLAGAQHAAATNPTMSSMAPDDLAVLREAHRRLLERYDSVAWRPAAVHGEPHWGNRLNTPDGTRWVDFENVSVGPREWDLSFLPAGALSAFADIDVELLGLMRALDAARRGTWSHIVAHMPGMPEFRDEQLTELRAWLEEN